MFYLFQTLYWLRTNSGARLPRIKPRRRLLTSCVMRDMLPKPSAPQLDYLRNGHNSCMYCTGRYKK